MEFKRYVNGEIFTNSYLVWDEESRKAMIIDPAEENPKIAEQIAAEKLSLAYIVLTHGHPDHTGGIAYFKALYPDAKLIASRAERKLLYERKGASRGGIKADVELSDGDSLDLGSSHMEFIMTPGHTPGGMCVYFPAQDTLFSGDTLFFASIGRTDLWGGDDDQMASSLKRLMELPDCTSVWPGHDRETSIGFERNYNPFV